MKRLTSSVILAMLTLTACGSGSEPSVGQGSVPLETSPSEEQVVDENESITTEGLEEPSGVDEALEVDEPLAEGPATPDGICTYVSLETVEQILPGAVGTAWEVIGEPRCDFYGPDGVDGPYLSITEFAADNSEFRLDSRAEEFIVDGTPLTIFVDDEGYEIGATIPTSDGMYGGFKLTFAGSDAPDSEVRPALEALASEVLANRT